MIHLSQQYNHLIRLIANINIKQSAVGWVKSSQMVSQSVNLSSVTIDNLFLEEGECQFLDLNWSLPLR